MSYVLKLRITLWILNKKPKIHIFYRKFKWYSKLKSTRHKKDISIQDIDNKY